MRLRLTAPRGATAKFDFLDSLHGALVNAWTSCGIRGADVVGHGADNWSFGAVGSPTSKGFILKSVVVGAEGVLLEAALRHFLPEKIQKQSINGDVINLSAWDITVETFPLVCQHGESATLPAIMLSPLALSVRGQKGRWHDDLSKTGINLQEAVNYRLSRLTGRNVRLTINPDLLFLRANPKHSILVRTRTVPGGKPAFVIGTMCPLSLSGSIEDLSSAWALGIGEKNRLGFGCIGHAAGIR